MPEAGLAAKAGKQHKGSPVHSFILSHSAVTLLEKGRVCGSWGQSRGWVSLHRLV